jgi:hypothetical protein
MKARDFNWRRDAGAGRASGPAALVIAPPASLPDAEAAQRSIPERTLTPAARFSPIRGAKIAPLALSHTNLGEGAAAEVPSSMREWRAPHPHRRGTLVAKPRATRRAALPPSMRFDSTPSRLSGYASCGKRGRGGRANARKPRRSRAGVSRQSLQGRHCSWSRDLISRRASL